MNHLGQKNLLDGVQRAFQLLGINCGQLVRNILEHRVDHRGSGRLPFPSERRHFRADTPPVGWIIGSFYQPSVSRRSTNWVTLDRTQTSFEASSLRLIGRSWLTKIDSVSNFAMDRPTPANASSRRASTR